MSALSHMALAFTAVAGLISLLAAFAAGCFGLLMCRAMLRSPTASDLRREAVSSMLRQANTSNLTTPQRAAVLRAFCASEIRQGASSHPARSRGSLRRPVSIE